MRDTIENISLLQKQLNDLQLENQVLKNLLDQSGISYKKIRNMKVYEQSGYRYKSTPTIMLKGQWLKELGFEYGTPICVECSGGKLIITKADEIETTFTEIGTEPVMCVAEGAKEYGRRGVLC